MPVKKIIWKYIGKSRTSQPLSGEITAQTEADAMEIVRKMGVISPKIVANSDGLPLSINFEPPVENRQGELKTFSTNQEDKDTLSIPRKIGEMASMVENPRTITRFRRESVFFGEFDTIRRQSERAFAELRGTTRQAIMQADCHGKVQILLVVEHDEWEEKHEDIEG